MKVTCREELAARMHIGDFIPRADILNQEVLHTIRHVVRNQGRRVDDAYGDWDPTLSNEYYLVLDQDGDLVWVHASETGTYDGEALTLADFGITVEPDEEYSQSPCEEIPTRYSARNWQDRPDVDPHFVNTEIMASFIVNTLTEDQLKTIAQQRIENNPECLAQFLESPIDKECRRLYHEEGNKIAAIKYLRGETGRGLKEAKEYVEAL